MTAMIAVIPPESVLRQATRYVDRGWQVVPIPVRTKRPVLDGWPQLRLKAEDLPQHFGKRPSNIGVILGNVSGDLVDIDLDCDESVMLAPRFLTDTATFGRASRPRSHWLYVSADVEYLKCIDPIPFKDEAGHDNFQTLVELRTNAAGKTPGLQTVFPPSQHSTTGEAIEWDPSVDPARINVINEPPADLRAAVMKLAAACLVMRHARDKDAIAAWMENPTATPPPMPSEAIPKFREWMGCAPAQRPKPARLVSASTSASTDFEDAVSTYNRANARAFPTECSPCPICTSPDGFKASAVDGRWACFSARHSQFKDRGVEGAGGMFTGDQLDIDAFQWGRTRAEHLRESGFLAARPQPVLTMVAPAAAPPPPATPTTAAVEDEPSEPEWKPFPTDALPEPIRSFVKQAAKATDTDDSMVALPLLSLLASCIGTTRRARLKKDWNEASALWCIVVCNSGQNKSAAFNEATGLLKEHIKHAAKQFERDVETYKAEVADAKANHTKGSPPIEIDEPVQHRYMLGDVTVEAVVPHLRDNPRGLLLARDELAAWFKSFGAYKSGLGGDTETWLQLFNGAAMDVDRKGGGLTGKHMHVDRALVSVMGGIQPGALKRAISEESIDNGLLGRFLMAAPPDRQVKWTEDEIMPDCRRAAVEVVDWLLELKPSESGDPVDVELTAQAKALWIEHVNFVGLTNAKEPHNCIRSMTSKMKGIAARLALVVHMCRCASRDNVDANRIDAESLEAGLSLAWWMKEENARIYGEMGWVEAKRVGVDVKLLNLLRAAPLGLTLKELHRGTSNKHKGSELRDALARMAVAGTAVSRSEKSETARRAVDRWFALIPAQA